MLISAFGEWRPHVRHLIQLVLKMDIVQESFLGEKKRKEGRVLAHVPGALGTLQR